MRSTWRSFTVCTLCSPGVASVSTGRLRHREQLERYAVYVHVLWLGQL